MRAAGRSAQSSAPWSFRYSVLSHMADQTTATEAATTPSSKDIARAEAFTRETFVHAGETAATALGDGSPRRMALEAALEEIAAGHEVPSTQWRREWSLLLGLERLLSEDEPHLADGTTLKPQPQHGEPADIFAAHDPYSQRSRVPPRPCRLK